MENPEGEVAPWESSQWEIQMGSSPRGIRYYNPPGKKVGILGGAMVVAAGLEQARITEV